jgi:hypothetical protein
MFEVTLPLRVSRPAGDGALEGEIERVVDELAALDQCKEELLDFAVGLNDDTVEVEVTVQADDAPTALAIAISCVRAAIHATGGGTPGWDDHKPDESKIVYEIDDDESMEIRPLTNA